MTKFDKLTQQIKDLGLTAYEAKAYISLLENNPVTRYQLSKISGVPRSAIYNTIQKLEQLGAVNAQSTEPEKYVPLPPDTFLEMLQRNYETRIDSARKSLKNYEVRVVPDQLWNLSGYDNMILKARELIQKAEESLFISAWAREIKLIKTDLQDAAKRGVHIVIFSFTEIELADAEVISYALPEKELEKIWQHKMILISDRNEVIMGEAEVQHQQKTAWTANRALIDIALNHIILDITIYSIRFNENISGIVGGMQNGETDYLSQLLKKKHQDIKYL